MGSPAIPTIDWLAILPVIVLGLAGCLALALELLFPKRPNDGIIAVCILGIFAAIGLTFIRPSIAGLGQKSFGGMVLADSLGTAMTYLILIATLLVVFFSEPYLRAKKIAFAEFYPLALWTACGAIVMVTTSNLLVIFLGLETMSLGLYVLAGLSRQEHKSEESALKYFLLGAFASAFLLYGIAFVYGATGSCELASLKMSWVAAAPYQQNFVLFAFVLIFVGLGFKCAIFPFHQWVPDVYQGAPTNVTAFMSIVSKVAAFAVLWRVLDAFGVIQNAWMPILFWLAILTMFAGNLAALAQRDVKRIIGYSSIAHAGYLLVAVLAHAKSPDSVGPDALVFYLLSYMLMTVGALAVLTLFGERGHEPLKLADLHGLSKRSPAAAIVLALCMFSLVGLPPTAGFLGKLLIINDAVKVGLTPLAIVMAINSAISAYYYLGIVWAAYQPHPGQSEQAEGRKIVLPPGLAFTCVFCGVGVVALMPLFAQLQSALLGH